MKTILFLTVAVLFSVQLNAQKSSNISELLKRGTLPQNLELNDELQEYVVTTDHFNSDIFGNFINKMRVKGKYTRGLENGKVKWNNVTIAMVMQREDDFPAGTGLKYMEDYSYVPSADMLNNENFTGFEEHSAYAKNLIWDMMGIEGFAWACFEKLELNKPYSAKSFNGKMDLAGQGFFENRDVILTWVGVTMLNDEPCAAIQYHTMSNPVEYKEESMSMKGRSHYWGTIWVSLKDKQIEYAKMFEDVTAEMQFAGQTGGQIMNITREINFEKQIDNQETDNLLELEPWMTNEKFFTVNYPIEKETVAALQLEDWIKKMKVTSKLQN